MTNFMPGPAEIAIILMIGLLLVGIPAGVVLLVLFVMRRKNGRETELLKAENAKLRQQIEHLRRDQ